MSQEVLSAEIGIPKPTYAHYESGRSEPSIETLKKIADYFGCSIDYLLDYQPKDGISPRKQELIQKIKNMSDADMFMLEGILLRLDQEKQNPWLKNN